MNDDDLEFQKIHDIFRPKILRYLTRLVGEQESEDLTQDVFIRVNRSLKTFRGESQLSTWIYRIATNAAFDRLRSSSFQRTAPKRSSNDSSTADDVEVEDHDVWTGEKASSVETLLIRKEMNECIRNFVEGLSANYRIVVVLSELEGLKNNEIAAILGITLDTVKIRLHRARVKLEKEMETHCSFYRDERNELACDLKSAFKEFRDAY